MSTKPKFLKFTNETIYNDKIKEPNPWLILNHYFICFPHPRKPSESWLIIDKNGEMSDFYKYRFEE